MDIRDTITAERQDILKVHQLAFGDAGAVISKLVDDLLDDASARPYLSLGAFESDKMLGHILFTRAVITGHEASLNVQLLAPLAILTEAQGKGLGQTLINAGLERLKQDGTDLVFVLGHPGYYPRCGFAPAGVQGLQAPYPIPDKDADAWMVQELKPGVIGRASGTLKCAHALDEQQHWVE